ncbi:hypothetical protein M3J09_001662 [Ascochyta lentis]
MSVPSRRSTLKGNMCSRLMCKQRSSRATVIVLDHCSCVRLCLSRPAKAPVPSSIVGSFNLWDRWRGSGQHLAPHCSPDLASATARMSAMAPLLHTCAVVHSNLVSLHRTEVRGIWPGSSTCRRLRSYQPHRKPPQLEFSLSFLHNLSPVVELLTYRRRST